MRYTMSNVLENEFNYYLKHQKELVTQYQGKFLVIKNQQIIGVYNSEFEAYTETQKTQKLGTFLIQQCTPGEGSYTQTFHSRVSV